MNRGHVLADVIGLILGLISITLNCDWKQPTPGDETEESLEASLRGLEFNFPHWRIPTGTQKL